VRVLAQRSAQAAKDIKGLLTTSAGQVREGVDLVNTAGAALTEILTSINSVADIVTEIAAAGVEQSKGLAQVNRALAQMDQATQQNSALVGENVATANMLDQQARAMDECVSLFRFSDEPERAADRVRPLVVPMSA
jgi:methyl-accepting chemotaxis protein